MQRGDVKMRRSRNTDGVAMKGLLPVCFTTLRKGALE